MKIRLLLKVLGLMVLLLGLAMVLCGLFAYWDVIGNEQGELIGFVFSAAITLLFGGMMVFWGRGKIERIPRREGVMLVGLSWLVCGVFGSLPYLLCDPKLSVDRAFFETVSGLTTTGASVLRELDQVPRALLLWRSLTQWFGGLGILVLFVALLSSLGASGSKSLFRNESSFHIRDSGAEKVQDLAQALWRIYAGFTVVCFLGLRVLGMSWFDALNHALSTVSTGGFSTHEASLEHFRDWGTFVWIRTWVMAFMLVGSTNFLVWMLVLRRQWSRLRREEEGLWMLGAVLVATVVVFLDQQRTGWAGEKELGGVMFSVVSLVSNTGFVVIDQSTWSVASTWLLVILMLVGGSSGSTAGGVKISRVLLVVRAIRREIVHAFRPGRVLMLRVNGRTLDERAVNHTVIFLAATGLLLLVGTWLVALLEGGAIGYESFDLFVLVAACLSNAGACGIDHEMQSSSLFLLSLMMILGRLELFAVLALLIPSAWRSY